MQARIWGCRGSLATPGPETIRYGGNTSCVEVRLENGTVIVLDAGTGARPLGLQLAGEELSELHILLTHLHLDHLEGLGFFAPLRRAGKKVHVWGPPSPVRSLAERIGRYLSPPLFPLQLSDMDADITFHDVPDGEWELAGARISAQHVIHLGPTLGYRIEQDGVALAYLPDHEPALGVELAPGQADWISGYGLAHQADFLLHDAQYTEDEYATRVGWGHSSLEAAVSFALAAHARRLVLFHHDPVHSDQQLETMLAEACERWGQAGEQPVLAYEGMALDLG
jgi:phosphoribosyl 1,2-cyclic phosphodiesterase